MVGNEPRRGRAQCTGSFHVSTLQSFPCNEVNEDDVGEKNEASEGRNEVKEGGGG